MNFFNNFRNVRLAQNPSIDSKSEEKFFDQVMARATEIKNDPSIPESQKQNMFKNEFSADYSRLTPYHKEKVMGIFGAASFQQTPPNTPDGVYNAAKEKTNKLYPYLAKIKNGNDFLYLAATKTPGFSGDSFYTESNREKLLAQLNRIANEPYIQRNYPNIPPLLESAIKKLDEKIKGYTGGGAGGEESSDASKQPQDRGGRSTALSEDDLKTGKTPKKDAEDVYDIESFGPDAKVLIQRIDAVKKARDTQPNNFKYNYYKLVDPIRQTLNSSRNNLTDEEFSTINVMLENLNIDYINVFYGNVGVYKAGRMSVAVPLSQSVQEVESLLFDRRYLEKNQVQDRRDQIARILDVIQKEHINKNPGNSDVLDQIKRIPSRLAWWNARYTDMNPRNNTNVKMIPQLRY
jgi:hypothetical protein